MLQSLDSIGERKRPGEVLLNVSRADRDDRTAAEDREADRDEQSAQLAVLAKEPEGLDDVLAEKREVESLFLTARACVT